MATIPHRVTTNTGLDIIKSHCPPSFVNQTMSHWLKYGTVSFCDTYGNTRVLYTVDLL